MVSVGKLIEWFTLMSHVTRCVSDASQVYAVGAAPRVATFGHVRENSHGYEVARLAVFANVVATLVELVRTID